jgi:hypothetical protein
MRVGEPSASVEPQPQPRGATERNYAIALGLVLSIATLWALPRHIQAGDAGELTTVMLAGGVPHPSGYPWMRALGLLSRALFALGLPPATAAALPCAACGVAGWLVLHHVLARVVDVRAATAAIAMIGLSPVVLLHASDAEVWGPLILFTALVVRAAFSPSRTPFRVGMWLGLATSHHLTAVLLVPLVAIAAWPATARELPRVLVRGLAGVLVGLAPYLTLAIGEGGAWRWGDTRSLAGLVHHVSRGDYGVLSLSLQQVEPTVADQLARVAASLGSALSAGIAVRAATGTMLLVAIAIPAGRRASRLTQEQRLLVLGVAAAAMASGLAFPLAHNLDPRSPFGGWILERFDLMTLALLSLPLALAFDAALQAARRRALRIALALAAVALPARQLVVARDHGVPSDDDVVERYAMALLHTPPPDQRAIVLGTDDHRTFPVLYAQEVLGVAPHVLYVDASLLAHGWYRERLRARMPDLPDVDKPVQLVAELWRHPELAEIPIYLANDFSRPSTTLPRVPEGALWRVLPPAQLDLAPEIVVQRHTDALARIGAFPEQLPRPGHPFADDLMAAWAEKTFALASALRASGHDVQADALAPAPHDGFH